MFDLEKSIADWREQMLSAGIKTPAPLEELESHLREEIELQKLSGFKAATAFESAVQKIGQVSVLKAEFSKMDGAKKSTRWERWVVDFMTFAITLLGTYTLLKNEMSLSWRLAGFANFAVLAFSILAWRYINKSFPVISNKRVRTVIGVSFGLLGMGGMVVFMNFILPNFEFTEGQLSVVVLWMLTLMAGLGVVSAGLEEAARKQIATSN